MASYTYRRLQAPVDDSFRTMTFPVYRHLLSMQPAPRHPEQGDVNDVRPLAIAAYDGDEAVGLVLAVLPTATGEVPEVLSLCVVAAHRNRGVGTRLVLELENLLREGGVRTVEAVYMTGKESVAAIERILEKRGWPAPAVRTVTLRFTPEEAYRTDWFGRLPLEPPEYEIFPWTEVTDEDREHLQRSNESSRWIAEGLEPWTHDKHGFDPISSVGLRYRGEIVGWVINHRVSEDTVRFTCSFMRKDLGRRGRILPLYTAAIKRLRGAGVGNCLFVAPVEYPNMVAFVKRRCAPWAGFLGETRGSIKDLGATAG